MSLERIQEIIESMDPREAASVMGVVLKDVFSLLDNDARLQFIMNLTGESGGDEVSSLVHL